LSRGEGASFEVVDKGKTDVDVYCVGFLNSGGSSLESASALKGTSDPGGAPPHHLMMEVLEVELGVSLSAQGGSEKYPLSQRRKGCRWLGLETLFGREEGSLPKISLRRWGKRRKKTTGREVQHGGREGGTGRRLAVR